MHVMTRNGNTKEILSIFLKLGDEAQMIPTTVPKWTTSIVHSLSLCMLYYHG